MNETKPKKRINRGFLVSMVLLGVVVLYVAATQLMLIPQKNELRKTADSLRQVFDDIALTSQEDAKALGNKAALTAKPVSYTHLAAFDWASYSSGDILAYWDTPLIANILLIIIAAATLIDIGVTTYRAVKYSESSR